MTQPGRLPRRCVDRAGSGFSACRLRTAAVEANAHRLRTPQGRALCKRRAPDVEGLHASLKDRGGLRRFHLRGLPNATSEFLFADLARNLRLLAAVS